MSTLQKRTRLVFEVVQRLVSEGASRVRPGDVAAELRTKNQPLGIWEVRYEFSTLEASGLLRNDPDSGEWELTGGSARKKAG